MKIVCLLCLLFTYPLSGFAIINNTLSIKFVNHFGELKMAKNCKIQRVPHLPIYSVKALTHKKTDLKHVKLLSESRNFSYDIYEGSLVYIVSQLVEEESSLVKVLSYQGNSSELTNILLGRRGTVGELRQENLVAIEDDNLEVAGWIESVLKSNFVAKDISISLKEKSEDYRVAHCSQRELILFNIHNENSQKIGEFGIEKVNRDALAYFHKNSAAFDDISEFNPFEKETLSDAFSFRVCSEKESETNVYDKDIQKVFFQAASFERIIPIQSFSESVIVNERDGEKVFYQEVKFVDRAGGVNTGWIERRLIRLPHECEFFKEFHKPRIDEDDDDHKKIKSIFPVLRKTIEDFDSGARRFGARRGGGRRLHAANDLYRLKDDPVVAINNGRIVRSAYYFYLDTYAIEVQHSSGRIVRYGEITGLKPGGQDLVVGAKVKQKDILGFVGKVNSGCCHPMLHFELFSGQGSGPLSIRGRANKFKRRWDLLDPTAFLKKWESEVSWE